MMASNKKLNEHCSILDDPASKLNKSDKLMQKISIQNDIILQISKAISFCKNNKQFSSSIEHIEAEKVLLIASKF